MVSKITCLIDNDIKIYQQSLASTVFVIEAIETEEPAATNDSSSSIWRDAKVEVKIILSPLVN